MTPDEDRLEDALRAAGDDYLRRNPADFAAARTKLRRMHRRRRLKTGMATAVAGAAAVAVALYAWPSPRLADESLPPAGPRVTDQVVIEVGDGPTEVAVGDGAIWVSNTSEGTVSRIDPASNREVAKIDVTGAPGDLAVANGGTVWVANPELGVVQRIDAATSARTPDVAIEVGDGTRALDLGVDRYLWVSVVGEKLVQIDPRTTEVIRTIDDVSPVNVAARGGRVFVLEDDGTVVELDGEDGSRTGFERSFDVSERGDVHFYDDRLWVAEGDGSELLVAEVTDPAAPVETHTFAGTYTEMVHTPSRVLVLSESVTGMPVLTSVAGSDIEALGGVDLEGLARDLVQGAGSLWVSNVDADTVTRLEVLPPITD